ncbi:MAG: RNA 2',3'-cyclic phosphodiesterase, partial [Desulfuromonadaceae bacterium]|nr:RNA 2',3'-cyclic phosphodiesterase [Desulfuromonadaceae bacterium]
TVRAFLAVPLAEPIVAAAHRIQRELAGPLPEVRWTAPETMHLTIKFFGDVPQEGILRIMEIMHLTAPQLTAFDTGITGLGAFPSPRRATVLWLGVANLPAFRKLHAALEDGLAAAGIERDQRPFTPHLTLGRSKKPFHLPDSLMEKYRHISCEATKAETLVLFESRLRPQGAVHLPLLSVTLTQRRKM